MPLCALGVCRACMPPMCALYVRLVHVPYVYALNVFRTCIPHLRCQQLRHVLMCTHVLMCMPCMCALYVFLQCVPYIHASHIRCQASCHAGSAQKPDAARACVAPGGCCLRWPCRAQGHGARRISSALWYVCMSGLNQNVCTVRMSALDRRSRWPLSPLSSSHFPHTARPPSPTPSPTDPVPAGPYMYVCIYICICIRFLSLSPSLPLSLSLSLSINHTLSLSISFRGGKSGNGQGND